MTGNRLDPHVWHVNKWEDIIEVTRFLEEGKHSYEWVSLDGMTRMTKMALRWILRLNARADIDRKPGMVMLKDRGRAGELVEALLYRYHAMNDLGVIITSQERIVTDKDITSASGDDSDEEASEATKLRYVPDLPKGVRASALAMADVIGRLYVVPDPEDEGRRERRLWLAERPEYDTGFRSCYQLPDYLRKPTIPRLVSIIEKGKI